MGAAQQHPFDFALIGDQQYDGDSDGQFRPLMSTVDDADLAFVVHVGDFRSGTEPPCCDALLHDRLRLFDACAHPLVFTPGDNDWADCGKPGAGEYGPLERLARLRSLFFPPRETLGRRRFALRRQSEGADYPEFCENAYWETGGVAFATIHVIGEENGLWDHAERPDAYERRYAANLAWLEYAFGEAHRSRAAGLGLFTHANPHFETRLPHARAKMMNLPTAREAPAYDRLLSALERLVCDFGRPVLFMHGDTHYFRVDKPLFHSGVSGPADHGRQIENFTRVETFGYAEAHWVRISVNAHDPNVFAVRQEIVKANCYARV